MLCEKCQAPQNHVVFKILPPFLPAEIAMRKKRWEHLISKYVKILIRQEKVEGQLNADPQLVYMQKCLGELAIYERPRRLQTWSCQQEKG